MNKKVEITARISRTGYGRGLSVNPSKMEGEVFLPYAMGGPCEAKISQLFGQVQGFFLKVGRVNQLSI